MKGNQVAVEGEEAGYRYRLLAILLTATMFSVMNSSMVNVALPTLMADFHVGIDTSVWLYTGYTLPYAVAMPSLGVWGERIGPKRVFLVGVVVFLVASLLCSVAWNFPSLLAFRVVQALGAAAVIPNAMVLITAAFPPTQRGQALGLWSATSGIGAGVGPALGGVLTQYVSWHAIFWVNAPFLAALTFLGARAIRPLPATERRVRFDFVGAVLLTVSLGALMLGLTTGQADGWEAAPTLWLFVVAVLGVAGFLLWEFGTSATLLPIALFRRRAYSVTTTTAFLQAMVMFGILLLLPLYLQSARGHTPTEAGFMILPLSLALMVVAPIGGTLSDRLGPRIPTMAGMILVGVSMIGFAELTLSSSYLELALLLTVAGVGIALSISPLTSTAMNSAEPQERGRASGFFNTLRFLGAVVGSTLLSVILTSRTQAAHIRAATPHLSHLLALMHGFHDVYLVSAAISLAAVLTAILLRPGHQTRQQVIEAERLTASGS